MKNVSEVELAYEILRQKGQAMYFRNLITEALENKGRKIYSLSHAIAEVHTQINMDSRFVHMGKGMWGLLEWSPQYMNSRNSDDQENVSSSASTRRERLFEEIQQDYVAATTEIEPE
jgi:DNA-directed RNA polymerase subunit delta